MNTCSINLESPEPSSTIFAIWKSSFLSAYLNDLTPAAVHHSKTHEHCHIDRDVARGKSVISSDPESIADK
jgi:hypothetical protein